MASEMMKLKPCAFGWAIGLIWGLGILLTGWLGWLCHWAIPWIKVLGSAYIGYAATFWGAVLGGIWGLVDGFIFGVLVAWIYNCCAGGCCKKSCDSQAK
jgi:hypothetical protein